MLVEVTAVANAQLLSVGCSQLQGTLFFFFFVLHPWESEEVWSAVMVLSRFKNLLLEAGDWHCENWFAMTTAMQPACDQQGRGGLLRYLSHQSE